MWKQLYYMQLIKNNRFNIFENRKRNFTAVAATSRNNSIVPCKKARIHKPNNRCSSKQAFLKNECKKKRNTNNNRGSYSKQSLLSATSSQSFIPQKHHHRHHYNNSYRAKKRDYDRPDKHSKRKISKNHHKKMRVSHIKTSERKNSFKAITTLTDPIGAQKNIIRQLNQNLKGNGPNNKHLFHNPHSFTALKLYPNDKMNLEQTSIIYNDFINHFSDSENESMQKILLKKSFSCSDNFSRTDIWEEDNEIQEVQHENPSEKQPTFKKQENTLTHRPDSLEHSESKTGFEANKIEATETNESKRSLCPFTQENFQKFQSLMLNLMQGNMEDFESKDKRKVTISSKEEIHSLKSTLRSQSSHDSSSKPASSVVSNESSIKENEEKLGTLEKIRKLFADYNFKNCEEISKEGACNLCCCDPSIFNNSYCMCTDNCGNSERLPHCQLTGEISGAMSCCPTNFELLQNQNCFNNKSLSQSISQLMHDRIHQHQKEQQKLEQQIEQQQIEQQQIEQQQRERLQIERLRIERQQIERQQIERQQIERQQIERQQIERQQIEQQTQLETQNYMGQQIQLHQRMSQPSSVDYANNFYNQPSPYMEDCQDTNQQQSFNSSTFFTFPYIFPKRALFPEIKENKNKELSKKFLARSSSKSSSKSGHSSKSTASAMSNQKGKQKKLKANNFSEQSSFEKSLSKNKLASKHQAEQSKPAFTKQNFKTNPNQPNRPIFNKKLKGRLPVKDTKASKEPQISNSNKTAISTKKLPVKKADNTISTHSTAEGESKHNVKKENKSTSPNVYYTNVNYKNSFSHLPLVIMSDNEKIMSMNFLSFGETLQLIRLDVKNLLKTLLNKIIFFIHENMRNNANDFEKNFFLRHMLDETKNRFEELLPLVFQNSDDEGKKRGKSSSSGFHERKASDTNNTYSDSTDEEESNFFSSKDVNDKSVRKYLKKEIKRMAMKNDSTKSFKFLKPGLFLSDRSSSDSLYHSLKKKHGYKKWKQSVSNKNLHDTCSGTRLKRFYSSRSSKRNIDSSSDNAFKHAFFFSKRLPKNYKNSRNKLSKTSMHHHHSDTSEENLHYSHLRRPSHMRPEYSSSSMEEKRKISPRLSKSFTNRKHSEKNQSRKLLLKYDNKDKFGSKDNRGNAKIHYIIVKDERDAKKAKKSCSLPEAEHVVKAIDLSQSSSTVFPKKESEKSFDDLTSIFRTVKKLLNSEELGKLKNILTHSSSSSANHKLSSTKAGSSTEKFSETSTLKGSDSYKSKASLKVFPKTKLLSCRNGLLKRSNKQDKSKSSSDFTKSDEIERKKQILNAKKKVLNSLKAQMLNKIKLIMKTLPKGENIKLLNKSSNSSQSNLFLSTISRDSLTFETPGKKRKKEFTETLKKTQLSIKSEEDKKIDNKVVTEKYRNDGKKKHIETLQRKGGKRKKSSNSNRFNSKDKSKKDNEYIREKVKKIVKQILKKEKKKPEKDSEKEETPNQKEKKKLQKSLRKYQTQKISTKKKRNDLQPKSEPHIYKPTNRNLHTNASHVNKTSPIVRSNTTIQNDDSTEDSTPESSRTSTSSVEMCVTNSSEKELGDGEELWEMESEKENYIKNVSHLY